MKDAAQIHAAIDDERRRTVNPWLACLGSQIFQAECDRVDVEPVKRRQAQLWAEHPDGEPPARQREQIVAALAACWAELRAGR